MSGFLKEYPQYTEEDYKWRLSVVKRIVMLADAPRVEYKKIKDKKSEREEVINTGTLDDFMDGVAQER